MRIASYFPSRRLIVYGHDIFMAAGSFVLALFLRMGDTMSYLPLDFVVQSTLLFTAIAAPTFWFMGLYRGIWRYASMNDVIQITKAVTVCILVFLPLTFLWTRAEYLPRSLPVINWFVLIALLGGPRFVFRLLKDRRLDFKFEPASKSGIPVLLVGAGDAAETFIRELARQRSPAYRIVGTLDEKGRRVGRHIHNVPILGTPDDMPAVLEHLAGQGIRPQRLIATKDELKPDLARTLLDVAEANGMTLSRLPRLTEFRSGDADRFDVRPVDVEDLLGRPQAVLDRPAMHRLIAGKRVLITGAGGTIGSELTRQVAELAPGLIILVDNGEYNLYAIDLELAQRHGELPRAMRLADVRDQAALAAIFAEFRPDLVFHAAALKHVPIAEYNPFECIHTNVLGAENVVHTAIRRGVKKVRDRVV